MRSGVLAYLVGNFSAKMDRILFHKTRANEPIVQKLPFS